MTNKPNSNYKPDRPAVYQIRIKGQLGSKWADWFEGMTITVDNGDTMFTGPVADQAALHGVLIKLRNLNLTIVSVNSTRLESNV